MKFNQKYIFKKLFISSTVLFLILLLTTGCKREGCIDKDAINYDNKAKKDDGSCEYSAKVVFWTDKEGKSYLDDQGVFLINFFFNDKIKGFKFVFELQSFDKAPDCNSSGTIKFTQSLGNSKTYLGIYTVISQSGDLLSAGPLFLNAAQCRKIKLEMF